MDLTFNILLFAVPRAKIHPIIVLVAKNLILQNCKILKDGDQLERQYDALILGIKCNKFVASSCSIKLTTCAKCNFFDTTILSY